jgi:quinol monooxygenase YgiN
MPTSAEQSADVPEYHHRMQIGRRAFLECIGAAAIAPVVSGTTEASGMYGLISKITVAAGKRDDMIAILTESAANMPGCFSYVLAKDLADENVVWVTEVWDTAAAHEASLQLPAVSKAITRARSLIAGFDKIAATTPVWGVGLPTAHKP